MSAELEDALSDLLGRMDTAEVRLVDLAGRHRPCSDPHKRLSSKALGVNLAKGYVREELQRVRAVGEQP